MPRIPVALALALGLVAGRDRAFEQGVAERPLSPRAGEDTAAAVPMPCAANHILRTKLRCHFDRKTLLGEVVDYGERSEPAAVEQGIGDEVHAPAGVGSLRHQTLEGSTPFPRTG